VENNSVCDLGNPPAPHSGVSDRMGGEYYGDRSWALKGKGAFSLKKERDWNVVLTRPKNDAEKLEIVSRTG